MWVIATATGDRRAILVSDEREHMEDEALEFMKMDGREFEIYRSAYSTLITDSDGVGYRIYSVTRV